MLEEMKPKPESFSQIIQAQREMDGMQTPVLNLDSVIFAIPPVGLSISAFFRMDELVGQPHKAVMHRRQVSGLSANGLPLRLDPDGRRPARISRRASVSA